MQCLNISNIIVTCQIMDRAIIFFFKYTCGLEIYPRKISSTYYFLNWENHMLDFGGVCIKASEASEADSPFGNVYIITIGFIVVVLMIIPMGYCNLDDNIWVQVGAFVIFIFFCGEWTVTFFLHGFDNSNIPLFAPHVSSVIVSTFQFLLNY